MSMLNSYHALIWSFQQACFGIRKCCTVWQRYNHSHHSNHSNLISLSNTSFLRLIGLNLRLYIFWVIVIATYVHVFIFKTLYSTLYYYFFVKHDIFFFFLLSNPPSFVEQTFNFLQSEYYFYFIIFFCCKNCSLVFGIWSLVVKKKLVNTETVFRV